MWGNRAFESEEGYIDITKVLAAERIDMGMERFGIHQLTDFDTADTTIDFVHGTRQPNITQAQLLGSIGLEHGRPVGNFVTPVGSIGRLKLRLQQHLLDLEG